ncbi:MAG: single-stranded DNA-binding protein [Alphaproteobacteria bacterium]
MSVNKVILVGNLGRDPEIRRTGDGKAVANLNLATTDKWKDKSGERQEKTEWHRVVVWGPSAEFAEKYMKKGDSAYIEGRLETRKWTDKEGQEKYTTEIVVDGMRGTLQSLGSRGGSSQGGGGRDDAGDQRQESYAAKPNTGTAKKISDDAPFDDEIPF